MNILLNIVKQLYVCTFNSSVSYREIKCEKYQSPRIISDTNMAEYYFDDEDYYDDYDDYDEESEYDSLVSGAGFEFDDLYDDVCEDYDYDSFRIMNIINYDYKLVKPSYLEMSTISSHMMEFIEVMGWDNCYFDENFMQCLRDIKSLASKRSKEILKTVLDTNDLVVDKIFGYIQWKAENEGQGLEVEADDFVQEFAEKEDDQEEVSQGEMAQEEAAQAQEELAQEKVAQEEVAENSAGGDWRFEDENEDPQMEEECRELYDIFDLLRNKEFDAFDLIESDLESIKEFLTGESSSPGVVVSDALAELAVAD